MKSRFWLIGLGLLVISGFAATATADVLSVSSGFGTIRAYPNPWKADQDPRPLITIDGLPPSAVTSVRIFTISGEQVRTLSGTQSVQWDLRNNAGENVASGIYIYLLNANGEQHSGKIAIIR
jgi:hypothetical protein